MRFSIALFVLGAIPLLQAHPDPAPIAAKTVSQIPSAIPTLDPSWRDDKTRQKKHVHEFLTSFGLARKNETLKDHELPNAIRKCQRILREPETGEYDEKMEIVMSRPRCGTIVPYNVTDMKNAEVKRDLEKRYVLWGPKWDRTTITYRFVNYTSDLGSDRQRAILSEAFATWNQYLPISIVPASSSIARADIHIRWMTMPSSETAYAFTNMVADGLAMSSGLINITFNDGYNWSDDRLFNFTAVHEIGHALGLSHSKVEEAIMFPYYDGVIRAMHPDDKAAVHTLYGWKEPRWSRIESNTAIRYITQVSSLSSTSPSSMDGLYQLRTTGHILFHTPSGSWSTISSNRNTIQISGAGGRLFQRHTDGSIYRYTGSGTNWEAIGTASDNVVDIVAASDQIYQRRKDGWIARWTGSGTTWTTIEQPASSKQIAITDSKVLWNLLSTGDLVRSIYPHGQGWTVVDINPLNSAIAVGGDEFYKLQSDGIVVWLDMKNYYWVIIENSSAVSIYAAGRYLYSKHADGSTWRYTGTPGVV
ncbi:zincin [Sporormia fimetaria CBS 119925]|uniref:Zincin n=1 Tax=Sporormia fimetaria CBS 119925 TaxID=1340428 RepID=A0A6A6UZ11_9PLEO|nr:zincin [Sporormia fimetaria CBS 119925]